MSRHNPVRDLRVDLHMHSTFSDGRLSPGEVLRRCAAGGLDVIALTDHDLPPVLEAGPHQIGAQKVRVLHGVELTTQHEGTEQHLLVYFPGEMPSSFRAFCRSLVVARADRYDETVRRLNLPGMALADERARQGERSLTRTHLAQALVQLGHASALQEAFDRFVGERAGIVPPVGLTFLEALRQARAVGGMTSWAHPAVYRAESWARGFAEAGLDALEVFRPSFTREQRESLMKIALRCGLHMTGGSDYHGWTPGDLGAFSVSGRKLRPLAAHLGLS